MSPTGRPEDRIERLLAVAGHPASNPNEAATALEGARKIAMRFELINHYGLRIIGIQMQLETKKMGTAFRSMGQQAEAIRQYLEARDME